MSLENIGGFVRKLLIEDDSLSDANSCRNSVLRLRDEIGKNFPKATVSFLAYPEARVGENVHYALLVDFENRRMIVNAVRAPGFPMYIGDWESALPTFFAMQESFEVK